MDDGDLWGFVLASALIELTPGPNMTWLALLAATEGRRAGLAAVAGVLLGLTGLAVAAAVGLAALVRDVPEVYAALRWAGVLYLLWLAREAWRSAELGGDGARLGVARSFRRGLVTNLLNPKAAVFYLTLLPPFLPREPALSDVLLFSAAYVAVATLVHASIVVLAGSFTRVLGTAERQHAVRRGMAVALAGVAVWLLWRT